MILKGHSSIDLNQLTMIEAVQAYLNADSIKKNIRVTSVKKKHTGSAIDCFTVHITVEEEKKIPVYIKGSSCLKDLRERSWGTAK